MKTCLLFVGLDFCFLFFLLRPQLSGVLNPRSPSTPVSLGLFTGLITPLHQGLSQMRWLVLFFSLSPPIKSSSKSSRSSLKRWGLTKALRVHAPALWCPLAAPVAIPGLYWELGVSVPGHMCACLQASMWFDYRNHIKRRVLLFFFKLHKSNQICINDRHMYMLL